MKNITEPQVFRDFSKGIYRKSAVSNALVPQNSVAHSINVNYDTIIGKGVVRLGTTSLGGQIYPSTSMAALGLAEFVPSGSTSGLLVAAYSTTTQAQLFYGSFAGSIFRWNQASTTSGVLTNGNKNRFVTLGGSIFRVNGSEAMTSSTDGNTWGFTNCMTSVLSSTTTPSLIFRSKSRLLAAGLPAFRDRVYFSSIINLNSSPTLTWSIDSATGNWIDVNPDDNSNITGFEEVSGLVLVFKGKGMYRLDAITTTVDTTNMFNIGAPSQEAIVKCQGIVYFFSGIDIRRTDGSLPEQISRLGVQEWIDAIPQGNWSLVVAGTDGINVYFSIGTVTLSAGKDDATTYTNVVLKFSPRDQTWSVHSYGGLFYSFSLYTTVANGRTMMGQDGTGIVHSVNVGTTDNGTSIGYLLETQEIDLGDRSKNKQITDNSIYVYTQNGLDSSFYARSGIGTANDGDFNVLRADLSSRVTKIENMNIQGKYFIFKWAGESTTTSPVFEGFQINKWTEL